MVGGVSGDIRYNILGEEDKFELCMELRNSELMFSYSKWQSLTGPVSNRRLTLLQVEENSIRRLSMELSSLIANHELSAQISCQSSDG